MSASGNSSGRQCCIHVCPTRADGDECLVFGSKSADTARSYTKEWLRTTDGLGKDVSRKLIEDLGDELLFPDSYGYHRTCYQRFTDKQKLAAAQKRGLKRENEKSHDGTQTKTLRRASQTAQIIGTSARVFGKHCIICRKVRYITDKCSKIRKPEALIQCQTYDAAEAIRTAAAAANQDSELMLIIEGEDLIAKEAMYHRHCYISLIRKQAQVRPTKELLQSAYEKFSSEVIDKRIISGGEVLRMSTLADLYSSYCTQEDGREFTFISNWNLKRKLKKSHPDLLYMKAPDITHCELVFWQAGGSLSLQQKSSDEYSESDTNDDDQLNEPGTSHERRNLFHSSQILKIAIEEAPKIDVPWPPLATDLNMDCVKRIVPCELFNFIARMVELTDDIGDDDFVNVCEDDAKKLFSICQDILYLKYKGRRIIPKHLLLGLTIRHLSGSMKLVDIANGFGHSMSRQSIIDFDSALAQLRSSQDQDIPEGFGPDFTTFVYDNNDFLEETLSGRGTTHCTTGIIVQRNTSQIVERGGRPEIPKARGKRITKPQEEIHHIRIQKRTGPSTSFSTMTP